MAFGRNFLPAISPFVWLMPGTYFLGLETVDVLQLLNSEGFPPIIVVAWIVDTIVNVALNFWAIPRYGITGASIVSSVCYLPDVPHRFCCRMESAITLDTPSNGLRAKSIVLKHKCESLGSLHANRHSRLLVRLCGGNPRVEKEANSCSDRAPWRC